MQKKTYTFKELIDHDRFCLGLCIGMVIGYNNSELSDIYKALYIFGNYKSPALTVSFDKLNIFQQLNILYNFYMNIGEFLFNDNYEKIGGDESIMFYNINLNKEIRNNQISNFYKFTNSYLQYMLPHFFKVNRPLSTNTLYKRNTYPIDVKGEITFKKGLVLSTKGR